MKRKKTRTKTRRSGPAPQELLDRTFPRGVEPREQGGRASKGPNTGSKSGCKPRHSILTLKIPEIKRPEEFPE